MKEKKLAILMAIVTAGTIFASGCGFDVNYKIKSDNSGSIEVKTYYTAQELKDTGAKLSDYQKVNINGKTFYLNDEQTLSEKASAKEMKDEFASLSKSKLEYYLESDDDDDLDDLGDLDDFNIPDSATEDDYFGTLRFTLPRKVLKTNGKLSSDGKSVTYDLMTFPDNKRMYAAFTNEAATSKKLTVSGVANKKVYNKTKVVKVSSPCVITSFKVNGKEQGENSFKASGSKKYTVKVKLLSGKTKTISFIVDKKKPTVNVKAKTYKKAVTLKFSDKLSGIKKAALNGKTIKNKKKVSKKGSYTLKVTDKAGNTTSVKFKIK